MNRKLPLVTLAALLLCALTVLPLAATAQAKAGEIRIAHINGKTGPLEAYAKQSAVGFTMGLDYATGGTMMVAGKKIVQIGRAHV